MLFLIWLRYPLKLIFVQISINTYLYHNSSMCLTKSHFCKNFMCKKQYLNYFHLGKAICEESWVLKNWCFWTMMLEKTLESPLDSKEIQPVHPKGDQSWVFIGRTDAEAETPVLWPPHAKSWLIGKDPDAGRDWGQEEKGTTEDEMVG